jgi:hypothetical protein
MNKTLVLIASATGLGGFAAGVLVGYKIAERKLALRFEERLVKETEEMRVYYQQTTVTKKPFTSPQEAAAALIEPGAVLAETARPGGDVANQKTAYHKIAKTYADDAEVTDPEDEMALEIMFPEAPVVENLFDKTKPYVITQEVFLENESGWNQSSLDWYVKDQVLADERDQNIEEVDTTVGKANLQLFGQGSSDPNVVHVRNPRLELEFEITRNESSYSRVVLGMDDDPSPRPSGRDR